MRRIDVLGVGDGKSFIVDLLHSFNFLRKRTHMTNRHLGSSIQSLLDYEIDLRLQERLIRRSAC